MQLAVAGDAEGGPRTVVGVRVSQQGTDYSVLADQVNERLGAYPAAVLADGGFASHACIDALSARGVRPLVSVPEHEKKANVRVPSEAVAAWRADMTTDDAKRALKARARRAWRC